MSVVKKQQNVFFLKKMFTKIKNMYNTQYQLIIIDKSLGLFFLNLMEISIMKKQIIAAAVAASMSAVALADVAITGSAVVNWNSTDAGATGATNQIETELDLNVVGKVGDTSYTVNLESNADSDGTTGSNATPTDNLSVKNSFLTTKVGDVDVKMGTWYTGDSNLNDGGRQDQRVSITTDMGPMSVNFQHEPGKLAGDHNEVTVKAAIGGVNVSYEMENTDSHKILGLSGDISGVKFAYTDSDSDSSSNADEESGYSLTTDIAGMTLTYQSMESTVGTSSDGFFGTFTSGLKEADGFGVTTNLAGNKVQVRNYSYTTATEAEKRDTKVIVTRALASGATAEVTYRTGDAADFLDVELAVKF